MPDFQDHCTVRPGLTGHGTTRVEHIRHPLNNCTFQLEVGFQQMLKILSVKWGRIGKESTYMKIEGVKMIFVLCVITSLDQFLHLFLYMQFFNQYFLIKNITQLIIFTINHSKIYFSLLYTFPVFLLFSGIIKAFFSNLTVLY